MTLPRSPILWTCCAVMLGWLLKLQQMLLVLTDGRLPGNDDYVRLAQVRDWMSGAGWFDVEQVRLGADGIAMHWSRIVDVFLAGFILLGGSVFGPAGAETFAVIAWPALLFGLAVLIAMAMARRLDASIHPALIAVLAGLNGTALMQFEPGRIDHHNVQIVLMSLAIWGTIDRAPVRGGALAGLACAGSIMIGPEALALIALIGIMLAIRWIVAEDADGARFASFGGAMALGTAAAFLVTVPPSHYALAVCDALSPAYAWPAVLGGFGAAALVKFCPRAGARVRLFGVAVLASASLATMLSIAPHCLGGPMQSLSDAARTQWLPQIDEAKGLIAYLSDSSDGWAAFFAYPLIALAAGAIVLFARPPSQRWTVAMLVLPVVAMTAMSLMQVRQSQFISILAIPLIAAALPLVRQWLAAQTWLNGKPAQAIIGGGLVVGSLALVSTMVLDKSDPASAGPDTAVAAEAAAITGTCLEREAYAALAALPAARVLNPHKIAGRLVTETRHTALVGPYHRSEQATMDGLALLAGTPADVRALAVKRGADYLAVCLAADGLGAANPEGLIAALAERQVPGWLVPISQVNGLGVFQIIE